jgi:hypothetical protein
LKPGEHGKRLANVDAAMRFTSGRATIGKTWGVVFSSAAPKPA